MIPSALSSRHSVVFSLVALLMLAATLALHIPLMLWDHIDLVPMYEAWRQGGLAASEFWRIHDGSHFHSAAYAVLLLTTWLSGGRPWLDCVASWAVYATTAWLLLGIARRGWQGLGERAGWWPALLLLLFHPGHLANLQWGWQVAVFISLAGAVAPIYLLTREHVTVSGNLVGVMLAVVGVLGFTTTLAVFPVAVALLLARTDWPWSRRVLLALPWLVVALALAGWLATARGASVSAPGVGVLVLYSLNYLGGGVLRFAEGLAPWWTTLALLVAIPAARRTWGMPQARPWLALMAFAIGCAVLTALGRAAPFGVDHAFVTRYGSFALLFWIGWMGLMVLASQQGGGSWRRWSRALLALTVVFAFANGVHMAKKAITVHERAVAYAAQIRQHYPTVDPAVMQQAYESRAALAHARLERLRERGFAPFDAEAENR